MDDQEEEDVYDVDFHYGQFVVAFGIHIGHFVLGPVSIPLLYFLSNPTLCHNMCFRAHWSYSLEFISHVSFLLPVLFYFLVPARIPDFRFAIIATETAVLLRLLMVTLKYGTFSKKWWGKINTQKLTTEGIGKTLLLMAWKNVPEDVATEQLRLSFGRLPLNTSSLHLIFRKPLSPDLLSRISHFYLPSFASVDYPEGVQREYCEKSYFVARLLLDDVLKAEDKTWLRAVMVMSVGYSVTPHIVRMVVVGVDSFQLDVVEFLLTPLSLFLCFFFSSAMLQFILVGILDFHRKKTLMSQCSALISSFDRIHLLEKLPKVDRSDPRSVFGWYYMRRSFLDFGKRFYTRVHLYTSVILPVLIAAVVMLVLEMFTVIGTGYNFELVPPLYLTLAFDCIVIQMIFAALELNSTFAVHTDLLLEAVSTVDEQETEAVDAILWTVKKLEVDIVLRPVKILGFTIDEGLLNKLVALALSGGFALVRVLLG